MIHHGFKKGKKVLVILDSGKHVVGKFKESTSNYIELENKKIKWSNIRSSTIYKNRTTITDFLGGKRMKINKLQVGKLQANCYFISKNNDLIIVDPGNDYEKIKVKIGAYNLKAVFLTHGHFDHNGALEELINDYKVPVNPATTEGFDYQIISNTGHTKDSVSFYFSTEKVMFTGDFLFCRAIGRTDLPGGNNQEMIKSLENIRKYPGDIKIYPGHGEETILAEEKARFDNYLSKLY